MPVRCWVHKPIIGPGACRNRRGASGRHEDSVRELS
jgi:hypothetical protein